MAIFSHEVGAGRVTVGRDVEMDHLARLLADAGGGRPAITVVRGEAGSGKTHLLEVLAARARDDGWTVLGVSGVEAETGLSGGGLLAVLRPLRDLLPSVPSAQAEALAAVLGWRRARAGSGDRFLVGAATLSLLAAAAVQHPVLLLLDDVQWLDVGSVDALMFAARRLGHDRVATALGIREDVALPLRLADVDVLDLAGLTPGSARELLGPGVANHVAARLVAETGGNPLALRECRRVLDGAQRAGAAPLPATLPVPQRLRTVYSDRLAALPPDAWQAVVVCAANLDGTAGPVLTALAELGLDAEVCIADAADVLDLAPGALVFRHPLLRSTAWVRASGRERCAAHAALAAVTDGAVSVWHRAEATTGHDPALADQLAAVAEEERARHGPGAASRAIERAARLTPDASQRGEWLAVATEDAFVAGDSARARQLAAEVLASDAGPAARAHVLFVLGTLEQAHGTLTAAKGRLAQAAELASGDVLLRVLVELFGVCHLLDDTAGMLVAAERAAAVADRDRPEQDMLASYVLGAARVVDGHPDVGAGLLHHATSVAESDDRLRDDPRHLVTSLLISRWLMDPLPALPYAERRIGRAREQGALGVLAGGLALYAMGLAWMGDHVRAYAAAGESVELLEALDLRLDVGTASEVMALESAYRGAHDEASRHLLRARAVVAANGFDPMPPHLARIVATCALCAGDLETVVVVLEDQIARFEGVGAYLEPLGVAPDLVEAYVGLGRDEDARALTARFRDVVQGRPQAQIPPVAAMVSRCEGLVADDLGRAEKALEQALSLHDPRTDRLESARTRLILGMRLRRGGRRVDARTHLRTAQREFEAMGLTLWAGRAAAETAATGERLQTREGTGEPLTSQETRVALLVATGLTNREVAASLFLSPKTVEHHVGAVLRKLGLRSRTELARSFARADDATEAP
ncbi:helix-turn-helix transcriptional regulator [Knoellia aerolata]|nr:LuxR family transcriptional regulator [Knoellia aerolata]